MTASAASPSSASLDPSSQPLSCEELRKMHAYWRAGNYLSVGQIYLCANPLLREPLKLEHIKPRLLGHWGMTPVGSCSDASPMHFTGKPRDNETNLDYFGARYDANALGRFMTPDPLGGHLEDPQTLNRYGYARNNPVNVTDPTGLDFYLQCQEADHEDCVQVQTDPKNKKSLTWVQANDDGTAEIVTSDSIRAGQNSAAINETGVTINGNSQGIYFDNPASHTRDANGNDVNHNPLDVAGSGDLKGFNFHVDGNCSGTCLSSGEWSSKFTYAQARETLGAHSFTIPFENAVASLGGGDHPYSTQYRFGGSMFGCAVSSCPDTLHVSVPFNPQDYPNYTLPASGGWHVDAHSGWYAHAQDIENTH